MLISLAVLDGVFNERHQREGWDKDGAIRGPRVMEEADLPAPNIFHRNVVRTDLDFVSQGDEGADLGVDHGSEKPCQPAGEISGQFGI